jgi:hypothetical protein
VGAVGTDDDVALVVHAVRELQSYLPRLHARAGASMPEADRRHAVRRCEQVLLKAISQHHCQVVMRERELLEVVHDGMAARQLQHDLAAGKDRGPEGCEQTQTFEDAQTVALQRYAAADVREVFRTFVHRRSQAETRRGNCRRQSRRAGTNDRDPFTYHRLRMLAPTPPSPACRVGSRASEGCDGQHPELRADVVIQDGKRARSANGEQISRGGDEHRAAFAFARRSGDQATGAFCSPAGVGHFWDTSYSKTRILTTIGEHWRAAKSLILLLSVAVVFAGVRKENNF